MSAQLSGPYTSTDGAVFFIKENSLVAKVAAKKLNAKSVAIVLGKTINLHNVSKEYFLKDRKWLSHELCHVHQFAQHGKITFAIKYLWESVCRGYYNNKYEQEAREAELN